MTLRILEGKITFACCNFSYFICIMKFTMLISVIGVISRLVFPDDNWRNLYDLIFRVFCLVLLVIMKWLSFVMHSTAPPS